MKNILKVYVNAPLILRIAIGLVIGVLLGLFVYPVLVAVIMALFFKEKITVVTMLCIVFALGGILLLYNGDNNLSLSIKGTTLVLLSALFYAIYIVSVNRSVLKKIPTVKLTFYMLLFGIFLQDLVDVF